MEKFSVVGGMWTATQQMSHRPAGCSKQQVESKRHSWRQLTARACELLIDRSCWMDANNGLVSVFVQGSLSGRPAYTLSGIQPLTCIQYCKRSLSIVNSCSAWLVSRSCTFANPAFFFWSVFGARPDLIAVRRCLPLLYRPKASLCEAFQPSIRLVMLHIPILNTAIFSFFRFHSLSSFHCFILSVQQPGSKNRLTTLLCFDPWAILFRNILTAGHSNISSHKSLIITFAVYSANTSVSQLSSIPAL